MGEIRGGCNCGAVRYELARPPIMVAVCHCRNCRRQSGSAFSVNMIIPMQAMTLTGDLTTYEDQDTESGQPVLRQFCSGCGTPLCSLSANSPGLAIIKVGTADEPEHFVPTMHIWTSTALPWVSLDASLPHFPKNPQ